MRWWWPSWEPDWSSGFRCWAGYPGILRLKPVVRFGYLVAQAVVPAFLSFIFIFSRHPLYDEFARSHAAIGLRPLNDQQTGRVRLEAEHALRPAHRRGCGSGPGAECPTRNSPANDPLVWADVERQFERADRRRLTGPVEPFPPSGHPPDHDLSERGPAATRAARGRSARP